MLVSANNSGKILLGFISAVIQWALTIFMIYYYPNEWYAICLFVFMLGSLFYAYFNLLTWGGYEEYKLPSPTSIPYRKIVI